MDRHCTRSGIVIALVAWNVMAAITRFDIVNQSSGNLTNAPVTFGQIFAPGDVPDGHAVKVRLADGTDIPSQCDSKATNGDNSVRHAILSLILPSIAANTSVPMELYVAERRDSDDPLRLADLLETSYDVKVTVTIGGENYSCSSRSLLSGTHPVAWLKGPVAGEWIAYAPLCTASNQAHPHLAAQFCVRTYKESPAIRTVITIENNYAFEEDPQGFTYNVAVTSAGNIVFAKEGMQHTHHSRWSKTFWSGYPGNADTTCLLSVTYNRSYLLSTGAFPYYDTTITISSSALSSLNTSFEPMSNGDLTSYMPETGAQPGIGPLPQWAALYLLSGDHRAFANTLSNGTCGGSFQIHYRDKSKSLPVSLDDYPYMTKHGNYSDTRNPATGNYEAFPAVTNGLATLTPDDAHQPSIAYVPYILTGDYFYLEELQFWANWNMVIANPSYREHEKGLLKWGQVRAQAWGMRTLGQTAYITPDGHPLKSYFTSKLNNNITWYTTRYTENPNVNNLGWLEGSTPYPPFGIAPWQDDFFTWSIGYLVQLGFTEATDFLAWKSKFVSGRMSDSGYCWLNSPAYSVQIGDSATKTPYVSFAQLYQMNFQNGDCSGLSMGGYPESPTGYGANMQPALAVAVDAGIPKGLLAWNTYETRSPKQDYTASPQFAVVPKRFVVKNKVAPQDRQRPDSGKSFKNGILHFGETHVFPLTVEVISVLGRKVTSFDVNDRHMKYLDGNRLVRNDHTIGQGVFLLLVKNAGKKTIHSSAIVTIR